MPELVPESFQFLTNRSLRGFQRFTREIIEWPDQAKIERSKLDRTNRLVTAGISNTVVWLERVLLPKWVPFLGESSPVTVTALKGDIEGNDAVRLRYKLNDTRIQVVSTSSGLNLVIQDASSSKKKSLPNQDEAVSYISDSIAEYLQYSDRIREVSLKLVKEQGGGFKGIPEVRPPSCDYWWGLVGWWTDGDVIIFSIGKADGGPLMPTLRADWLSLSP